MERLLTKRFTQFAIARLERETKEDFGDFLDVGNLSAGKMLRLIRAGNNYCSEEDAGKIADKFLENHTYFDFIKQLYIEVDLDLKIFKSQGVNLDEMIKELEASKLPNKNENNENETVIKNDETPKVDVNGFVSLD